MSFTAFGGGLSTADGGIRDEAPSLTGRFEGDHVLVPLLSSAVPVVTDQITVAATMARGTGAALSVINPVSAPEGTPEQFHQAVRDADADDLLDWVLEQTAESTTRLDGGFLNTRDVVTGLLGTVRTRSVDTLVLPSLGGAGRLRKGITEQIAAHAECDVVVVNGMAGYETVASVLLPIAGGPHSGLATDLARSIAADCDAWIDILHVIEPDASERRRTRAEALVEDAARRIARPETTTTWVLESDSTESALITQSKYYGLTIIGAPTKGRLRRFIYGSTNRSVRANARSVVLSARNNSTP